MDKEMNDYETNASKKRQNISNSFFTFLEIFTKTVSIFSVIGVVLGTVISFFYFQNIGHLSVFTDTIVNPTSFISILVVFGVLVLFLSMGFFLPYFILFFWRDIEKSEFQRQYIQSKDILGTNNIFWVIFGPLASVLIVFTYIFYGNYSIGKFENIILKSACFFLPILIIIVQIYYNFKHLNIAISRDAILELIKDGSAILILLIYMLGISIPFFSLLIGASFTEYIQDEKWKYLFLISYLIFLSLNIYLSTFCIANYKGNNIDVIISGFFVSSSLIVLIFIILIVNTENFPYRVLNPIRFVERPENSSWYLLHNNFQENNVNREINGIKNSDLVKLKSSFRCESKVNRDKCVSAAISRNNALFGYMAWNLGNTKIFCPEDVRNDEGAEENKIEMNNRCLIINGNFLQPIPAAYIREKNNTEISE